MIRDLEGVIFKPSFQKRDLEKKAKIHHAELATIDRNGSLAGFTVDSPGRFRD